LVRGAGLRTTGPDQVRIDRLTDAIATARADVRSAHRALARQTRQADAADTLLERLLALREEERHGPDRLDRLAAVLDPARTAAHVRAAVAAAVLVDDPVHAVVAPLLPPDVYDAVVDAIPPRLFFDPRAPHRVELPVPPRLAPTYTIVTWRFLADLASNVLAPALVEHFRGALPVHAGGASAAGAAALVPSQGRIVLRTAGYAGQVSRHQPWDVITTFVTLGRPGDGVEYGSRLLRRAPEPAVARVMAFRANAALVVLDATRTHAYEPIPDTAPPRTERYTYEFPIGATTQTKRRPTRDVA
jgi:hypothetical protein